MLNQRFLLIKATSNLLIASLVTRLRNCVQIRRIDLTENRLQTQNDKSAKILWRISGKNYVIYDVIAFPIKLANKL